MSKLDLYTEMLFTFLKKVIQSKILPQKTNYYFTKPIQKLRSKIFFYPSVDPYFFIVLLSR